MNQESFALAGPIRSTNPDFAATLRARHRKAIDDLKGKPSTSLTADKEGQHYQVLADSLSTQQLFCSRLSQLNTILQHWAISSRFYDRDGPSQLIMQKAHSIFLARLTQSSFANLFSKAMLFLLAGTDRTPFGPPALN